MGHLYGMYLIGLPYLVPMYFHQGDGHGTALAAVELVVCASVCVTYAYFCQPGTGLFASQPTHCKGSCFPSVCACRRTRLSACRNGLCPRESCAFFVLF